MVSDGVSGKHIVITGGASGIGAETAKLLAQRGAAMFIGDLNQSAGKKIAAQICVAGGKAAFMAVDVSRQELVEAFLSAAVAQFGGIDVAINNAGIDHQPAPMADVTDDDFHRSIAVNLTGVWYCMKHEIKHMLTTDGGHIINLASVAGTTGAPMISAYCAAKHGVIGLTKSAAIEYARANIRINAVCPSYVSTPMVKDTMRGMTDKQQKGLIAANPMRRLGEPKEIAGAIAWLCTDESSFMTGHSVVLDGGMPA